MGLIYFFHCISIQIISIEFLGSYLAIDKSTTTHVAETWCLKAKKLAKLNSTEMYFWRHSARISRKDKFRNTIIEQKSYVLRSLFAFIYNNNIYLTAIGPSPGGSGFKHIYKYLTLCY